MSSRKAAKKRPAACVQDAAQAAEGPAASTAADAEHVKKRGRPCKAKEEKNSKKSYRSPLHVYMEYIAPCNCQLALA